MSERGLIQAYVTIEAYLEALTNEELLKLLVKLGGDATTLSRSRTQMLRAVAAEAAQNGLTVGDLGRELSSGYTQHPLKASSETGVMPDDVWETWEHATQTLEQLAQQALACGTRQDWPLEWIVFLGQITSARRELADALPPKR